MWVGVEEEKKLRHEAAEAQFTFGVNNSVWGGCSQLLVGHSDIKKQVDTLGNLM